MGSKRKYPESKSDMYRVAYEQSLSERDNVASDVDTVRSLVLRVSTIGLVGFFALMQFSLSTESEKYYSIRLWWAGLGVGLFALMCMLYCVVYVLWTKRFIGQRSSAKNIIEQDIEGVDGKTKKVKNLSEFYRRMAISQETYNDTDVKTFDKMLRARNLTIIAISIEFVGIVLSFIGANTYA